MQNPFVKYREQLPAIFVPILFILIIVAIFADNHWLWIILCIYDALFIWIFTAVDILTQHKK